MIMSCCVKKCTKRALQKSSDERITYHCFPKDEKVLNKWIVAIRRKDWTPSKRSKLCSAHFTADSYETSGWSSRPRLKPDAVPTIFDFLVHPTKTERETQLQSLRESLFSTMSDDAILNKPPLPKNDLNLRFVSEDPFPDNSPMLETDTWPLLVEDPTEDSTDAEMDEPLHFSPEVIIEELPPSKNFKKKNLGDLGDDKLDYSNDDVMSFTVIAKKIIEKKSEQIQSLKREHCRLKKKVADLNTVLADLRKKKKSLI